ncbi:MAG: TatD family hydrolase [Clostridia bacterium]|nr:TatD family hydrolase [Clostridia bacterium]
MSYIDVHAHLNDKRYNGDIFSVVSAMKGAGVERVINSGFDFPSSVLAAELSRIYDGFYFSAGVHPEETAGFDEETAENLFNLGKDEKCVAIGETGLDYHSEGYDKAVQYKAFERQMEIADKLSLPFVVHSRSACKDTLDFLTEHKSLIKRGFLMHCYSESAEVAERLTELGAYFSFGGVITFKNARKEEVVASIPIDRLLSETDSPYLSPEPFRGTTNDPSRIPYIVKKLAEFKGVSLSEMARAIEENAKRLFNKCN